ncbi:hypothetical protein [Blastococcus saxobsidens]|uniref:Uncharacterized protein n=1 Tax=Blastococcus saxobsidens (strain DD2) TaxID=1146883 RepID=H6RJV1_BLASD|nr:hypothetical protein [Blastococcus saxobsidens]CCG03604.1 protein of unknown function [Blastococcus saxobsidens DD2]
MGDLYFVDLGDDEERARHRTEREAERARVRRAYVERLIVRAGLDEATAERAVAAVFDHFEDDGSRCLCGCHPQLTPQHGDGMDCPCTWGRQQREATRRTWLTDLRDSDWAKEARARHAAEEREIREWLAGQVDVTAQRTTSYAPEQWEGTVDGHSFYFRERHGEWRIELDLQPSGRFAERVAGVDERGRPVTEPVELTEGGVIAEGLEGALGSDPVAHLDVIVRTIREHLWQRSCSHSGALLYCPGCGTRM